MVSGIVACDDDGSQPPDYTDADYNRRLSAALRSPLDMTTAASSSSFASEFGAEDAARLHTPAFMGSAPAPPPYQRYAMATDAAGDDVEWIEMQAFDPAPPPYLP